MNLVVDLKLKYVIKRIAFLIIIYYPHKNDLWFSIHDFENFLNQFSFDLLFDPIINFRFVSTTKETKGYL